MNKAWDPNCILMDPNQICFRCATMGTPDICKIILRRWGASYKEAILVGVKHSKQREQKMQRPWGNIMNGKEASETRTEWPKESSHGDEGQKTRECHGEWRMFYTIIEWRMFYTIINSCLIFWVTWRVTVEIWTNKWHLTFNKNFPECCIVNRV